MAGYMFAADMLVVFDSARHHLGLSWCFKVGISTANNKKLTSESIADRNI